MTDKIYMIEITNSEGDWEAYEAYKTLERARHTISELVKYKYINYKEHHITKNLWAPNPGSCGPLIRVNPWDLRE